MYAVRNSSGKVVARFKTMAEAEKCVRRTAKSPVPEGWVDEIQAMLDKAGYAGDLRKHAERLVREGYGPEEIAYRIRTGQIERGLGIQMIKKGAFKMSPGRTDRSPGGRSYTTRAAFMRPGARGWSWVKWTHGHANKHAAIVEKAKEIGATLWDFGQADHFPTSEYPHQSR